MVDSPTSNAINSKLVVLAILVGLGVVLHRVETLLPLPSPWVKLGLANIMTLVAMALYGFRAALMVTLLRVLLGSLLAGTFLGPTFFLSLSGGLAAVGVMALVFRGSYGTFSLIGVSVAAAYAHTLAIFFVVFFFFIFQNTFLNLLPVFLTFSLISGILTGLLANNVTLELRKDGLLLDGPLPDK